MSEEERRPDRRRALPSLDSLLGRDELRRRSEEWGRVPLRDALRTVLAEQRTALAMGCEPLSEEALVARALSLLDREGSSLRSVINGTGVILHTNLGRAPMSTEAADAAARVAVRYSTLEFDLETGRRGDRHAHCTALLRCLTGSEDALVVNNNAAAVSLAINELSRGRDVIVSRGELVEIGGGFRIPEVIERSGGFLVEVGTTNRTRIDDYRRALTPSTGLLLKVHPSNYRVEGFVEETSLAELAELGRGAGVPVMHDLGSAFLPPGDLPIPVPEPPLGGSVAAGADLISWSGDKLFGGPQAGILHGHRDIVTRLRTNPLLRAFRVGKMTLAALEATLRLYRDPELSKARVPALRMLLEDPQSVEERARRALVDLSSEAAGRVRVVPLASVLGGGAAPGFELPSAGWELAGAAQSIDAELRLDETSVIGRVENGRLCIDFRTILPGEEAAVAAAVDRVLRRADIQP